MMFRCPFHKADVHDGPCPECDTEYETRRDVLLMTSQERADELEKWFDNILTIDFSKLHKRIEELVGRPVWTHEMGDPHVLVREVLLGEQVALSDVVKKATDILGPENIIVVTREEPDNAPS